MNERELVEVISHSETDMLCIRHDREVSMDFVHTYTFKLHVVLSLPLVFSSFKYMI
jgi:hypothetical protein